MLSKEMVELLSQYGYTAILLMVLMLWLGKYLEKNRQLEQDDRKRKELIFQEKLKSRELYLVIQ